MVFENYRKQYREDCIGIFDSNLEKFFDNSERNEFIEELDSINESSAYYVCRENNNVIACGGIGKGSNVGSLCWGMVHRAWHHKGIGKKLTSFRVNQLRSIPEIELIKIETSQHTEAFYLKQGFVTTKVIENGFGDGIDCVSMELKINSTSS